MLVGADISGLSRGLQQADRALGGFASDMGSRLTRLGGQMQSLGTSLTVLTAPLAVAFGAGINAASDFEDIMAEIGARTGATAEEMRRISDFALEMGANTAFSAQQAGDAFLQLLSSGQSVEEAMATLPAVLDAAAASGEDLGTTADTLTDIMASFSLGVESAADVANILAQAAGASSADMASLGQGFANVGNVAASFGLSVENTAAALAVLSENGIKGAEAGTALKSMLLNMTRNTDDVQGAWDELGISFYDASGTARDLGAIIADLDGALDGLPMEEQNRLMQDLAGSYGITALSALRGSISIDEMRAMMEGSASAADVAAARMDTFSGAVDSLMGSLETLAIEGLSPIMDDYLKPLVQGLTRGINAVTAFAKLNPKLTASVIALGAALVAAGPALAIVGTVFTVLGAVLPVVGLGFGLIVAPLALVAAGFAAVMALGGTLGSFLADVAGVSDQVSLGLYRIGAGFQALGESGEMVGFAWIKSGLREIGEALGTISSSLLTNLGDAFRNITGIDLSPLGTAISDAFNKLMVDATVLKDKISTAITNAVNGLILDLTAVGTAISTALGSVTIDSTPIQTALATALTGLSGLTLDTSGLQTAISTALTGLGTIDLSSIQQAIADNIEVAIRGAVAIAAMVFSGPVGIGLSLAALVVTAIENDFLGIGTFLEESGIAASIEGALNGLVMLVQTTAETVFGGGDKNAAKRGGLLEGLFSGLLGSFEEITLPDLTPLTNLLGGIKDNLVAIFDPAVTGSLIPGIKDVGDGLKGFFDNLAGTDTSGFDTIGQTLVLVFGAIGGIVSKLAAGGVDAVGGILSAIGDNLPALGTGISQIASAFSIAANGDLGGALSSFGGGLITIKDALVEFTGDALLELADAIGGLIGIDVEGGLAAWGPALEKMAFTVEVIFDRIKRDLEQFFRDAELKMLTGVAQVQQNLGLGEDSNLTARRMELATDISLTDAADQVEQALREQLATGTIDINTPIDVAGTQLNLLDSRVVFDREALVANMSLEGRAAIQEAINLAISTGDENLFYSLVPLATELGISEESLIAQFQAAIDTATAANFFANVVADISVLPGVVNVGAVFSAATDAIAGALSGASGGSSGVGAATVGAVPSLDTGGTITGDGLIYAHAGEVIRNERQQGGGGRAVTVNVTNYGSHPHELVDLIQRTMQDRG